jgi:phosphotransferase family enzyme
MSSTAAGPRAQAGLWAGLRRFGDLPSWLQTAAQPERVAAALAEHVGELASGRLALRACDLVRVRLKGPTWDLLYRVTVEPAGPEAAERRTVGLLGLAHEPGTEPDGPDEPAAFGSPGWRCVLPGLGLELRTEPPDDALPAMRVLPDPAAARELLETGIRACSPAYSALRIAAARPQVLRYNPGSRATIRVLLDYAPDDAARGWPELVIVKTHHGAKGHNAWEAMRALWDSPLATGGAVRLAEPLAYLPELRVLVQGPIPGQLGLDDLIAQAVRDGGAEAFEELGAYVDKAAAGLAALHGCGLRYGSTRTLTQEIDEARSVAARIAVPAPDLVGAAGPLLARLEEVAAATEPDPPVPTHRSFRPGQVLLDHGRIGFVDFDGFCTAEPALDVALFRSDLTDTGMAAGPEPTAAQASERLARLDELCERFLAAYQTLAPVSRERVALWEAVDLLTCVLHSWTKVQPRRLRAALSMLERQLLATELARPERELA